MVATIECQGTAAHPRVDLAGIAPSSGLSNVGGRWSVPPDTSSPLWASVQGDPVFMRRVNGWLTIFWIVMIPVSITLGLLSSVAYVSALSLWALVSGHWSAWQAARVEVAQQAEAEKQEADPIEARVVDKLIQDTDINLSRDRKSVV